MKRLNLKKELYLPNEKLKIYEDGSFLVEDSIINLITAHPDKLIKLLWNCNRKIRIDRRQFLNLLNELEKRFPDLAKQDKQLRNKHIKVKSQSSSNKSPGD